MVRLGAADKLAVALVAAGALNWGLVGVFKWNLVAAIFGAGSAASRVIYILIGLGAVWTIAIAGTLVKRGPPPD